MRLTRILLLLSSLCLATIAQPTGAVLERTLRVQSKFGTGTIFSIDVDGREYWITAAHIVTGATGKPYGRVKEKTIQLQLLDPGGEGLRWLPENFSVLQPEADVDLVALAPEKLLLDKETVLSPPASSNGFMFGGPCEFLGYPLGGGWRAKWDKGATSWMPFIKHCTVSGTDTDSRIWILDGINNRGFSGGPVIMGTGGDIKFVAVISGYYLEPAEIIRGRTAKLATGASHDYANVNSGFIIAYDIAHAVDRIRKNPIGPIRPTK